MKLISIDYQGDFAAPSGRWYKPRKCQDFISTTLIPWLRQHQYAVSEIISDYRLPRPSEREAYCVPGTPGYQSLIPEDLVEGTRWIKAMNSPVWRRKNGGDAAQAAGSPYSDTEGLSAWLEEHIGAPDEFEVVLFGLTLDCCVLCAAQELYFRGYKARYLYEAVDTYNGSQSEKEALLNTPLPMWGSPITFAQLQITGLG
jgi:nicotinamidase-related amidase